MSNARRPKNQSLSHERQRPPRATSAVVATVVLLCVGAIIVLAVVLGGRGKASGSTDGPNCTPVPPVPASPQRFTNPPDPSLSQSATWNATVMTNCGAVTMELDGAVAPQTVASFIFLAQKHFFDDSPCHRLTTSRIFVLQCGDPTGTGTGGPGYGFGIENAPTNGDFPAGTVAMARGNAPDTNGSQFFVVYKDTRLPTATGGYSIFGKVTQGLSIVKALAAAGVSGGGGDGAPAQPVSILSVTVRKG